jgi:hypothetical protein
MGNDASRVAVVSVCRGSLVRAQVGARSGREHVLWHRPSMECYECPSVCECSCGMLLIPIRVWMLICVWMLMWNVMNAHLCVNAHVECYECPSVCECSCECPSVCECSCGMLWMPIRVWMLMWNVMNAHLCVNAHVNAHLCVNAHVECYECPSVCECSCECPSVCECSCGMLWMLIRVWMLMWNVMNAHSCVRPTVCKNRSLHWLH